MAVKIKNLATGEVASVPNTGRGENGLFYLLSKAEIGKKWLVNYPCFEPTGSIDRSHGAYPRRGLRFVEGRGFELVESGRKGRTPKAARPQPEAKHEPKPETKPEPKTAKQKPEPEQPCPKPEPKASIDDTRKSLYARYGRMGEDVFNAAISVAGTAGVSAVSEEMVRKILAAELAKITPQKQVVEVKTATATKRIKGVVHHKFGQICTLVENGVDVYLFGPAGTGKSQLAEQVGEALGLKVYQIGAVKDVYSLRGYGDAAGNYVPTSFYKAFTEGGLLIIDEADAMDAEASLELNGALAQRRCDFPIVGNKQANENFHVICTGNTTGMGATEEYSGRNVLDAALLNRLFMVEIDYDVNIEQSIAGEGYEDIVEFVHDLRDAAREANILLVVSYRNIAQLRKLCEVVSVETLITGCITKGMCKDEIRILNQKLKHKNNTWAKMFNQVAA